MQRLISEASFCQKEEPPPGTVPLSQPGHHNHESLVIGDWDLFHYTPENERMSMEKQPLEDVSPIKNCDFPLPS